MASNDDIDWLYGTRSEPTPPPYIAPAPPAAAPAQPVAATLPPAKVVAAQPYQPPTQLQPQRRRRRHPVRRIFQTVLILALCWLVYLVTVPMIAWNNLDTVDNVPAGQRPAAQNGTAILLVGSDSRAGLSDAEAQRLGLDTNDVGSRTDTMMVLFVPRDGRSVLISLPRDSYVDIPGYGPNKLNAAYAFGGPQLLTATVEQNTGLRIDGYAEVGFGGFATVVDAVDGVQLCPTNTIEAEWNYPQINPGCQQMDAKTALWYVRSRHSDAQQDLGRINRQREFMTAILTEVASPATVLNPVRYWKVTMAMAKGMRIGRETSQADSIRILTGLQSVSKDGLSFVVPIADPNATTAAGSSVLWDEEQAKVLFHQLRQGDTSDLDRFKPK